MKYTSDKYVIWRVSSCITFLAICSALCIHDFGADSNYGEDNSKSFTWAHKLDCWVGGLCAFSFSRIPINYLLRIM